MIEKCLSGETIDARASRKSFHLNEILSLSTGLLLAKEGAVALHRLVAYVMEEEAGVKTTTYNAHTVKQCLEEQLPFLKDLNISGLYPIFNYKPSKENPYLYVWLDMQALRYGAEHYIVPLSRWQKQKGSHKLPPMPANLDTQTAAGLIGN